MTLDCASESVIVGNINDISQENYTYQWTTNEGNIIAGFDQNVAMVNQPGLYIINVENTNNGCSAVDSQIVVLNRTLPSLDIGDTQLLTCIDDTLTLGGEGTSQGEQFIYNWTSSIGTNLEVTNTPFLKINKEGTYTLTVLDTTNSCKDSATIQIIEDKEFPVLNIPNDLSFNCTDESILIQPNTDELLTNLKINWSTLEGVLLSDNSIFDAEVSVPGTYYIEVEDLTNRCVIIDSVIIMDNRLLPTVANLEDRMLGCTNISITLDALGSQVGDSISYKWKNLEGNTLSNTTTLNVSEPGFFILEVSNRENSCKNTDTVEVSQNFDPPKLCFLILDMSMYDRSPFLELGVVSLLRFC